MAGSLFDLGCERRAITEYHIPTELPWKTPAGWKRAEAGGLRVARFSVPSTNGSELDVSIIPARGFSGSAIDLLNVWRQKLTLEPVNEETAAQLAQKVQIGRADAKLYDLIAPGSDVAGKPQERSLLAMAGAGGVMWFVKMTGPAAEVARQQPAFIAFLKKVNLDQIPLPAAPNDSGHPHPHAPGDGHNHEPTPGSASATVENSTGPATAHRPQWEVPPAWSEQPPAQFLTAKFLVAGSAGQKVDVNVSSSAGDGGGISANVNRWRAQLGLPAWEPSALAQQAQPFDASGRKATAVDFQGTDARNGQPARLIGVIVPLAGQTWFYKMLGDPAMAEREKAAFLKFVRTVNYPGSL